MHAYSKINLALDVGEKDEENGKHVVDTAMQTIDLRDNVSVTKRPDKQCTSVFTSGRVLEDDNALKAAQLFVETFDTNGADIVIGKLIPMGAGLGGSSADAAAVLKGMAMLYNIPFSELPPVAAKIGSDVPFLLGTGVARVQGFGEIVTPLAPLPLLYALLVFPKQSMSTELAYSDFDNMRKKPAPIRTEDIYNWLHDGRNTKLFTNNSLYPVVATRCPSVGTAIKELQDLFSTHIAMTGSGTCVYALYPRLDKANARLALLQEKGYQAKVCRLIN